MVTDFNTWLSLSGKYSLPINDTRLTGYGLLVEDGITTLSGNGVVLSADAINGPTFIQQDYRSDNFYRWNNDKAEEWEGTPTNLLQELGAYSNYGLDFSTLTNDFQFDAFQSTFIPAFATTQGSLLGNTNNVHI